VSASEGGTPRSGVSSIWFKAEHPDGQVLIVLHLAIVPAVHHLPWCPGRPVARKFGTGEVNVSSGKGKQKKKKKKKIKKKASLGVIEVAPVAFRL